MKNQTTLKEIENLCKSKLNLFTPDISGTGKNMVLLPLNSYQEAMDLILYLLKTCILALQADYVPDKYIGEPEINISEILKLIIDIVPYEEMEILDELQGLVK
ncbi:hypothetical protein [Autumnicola edwardsiae]|uniref:Uncharacterized protein n=1 Tax=Autumnicola edwardsiae TaxID=3075594 RepID=A0ABU3D0M3_9FLAO|nr:hypothetical protein [Zunongwangia sp. F297]MDT0651700.1 hypothetical protein [Zunongwangia sp. F297]